MRILVPTEWVERGWGIKLVAMVVHSIFVGVVVPQMWEFAPRTAMLSVPRPNPAVVAQVVHRKLLLQTGTSFWRSLEFGFGKQH